MTRKKGKKGKMAAKARTKPSPRQQRPSKAQRQARAAEEAAFSFSLADEARWASTHRSRAFDSDKKLRYLKIDFVSAGYLEGTIEKTLPAQPKSPTNAEAMARMTIRSPSPTPSIYSSSEDEIVFQGRSTASTQATTTAIASSSTTTMQLPEATPTLTSRMESSIIDTSTLNDTPTVRGDSIPQLTTSSSNECASSSIRITPPASDGAKAAQAQKPSLVHSQSDSDAGSVVEDAFSRRRGGHPVWMTNTTSWESRSKPGIGWLPVQDRPEMASFINGTIDPKAAALEDYMQNIREDVEADASLASSFAHRAIGVGSGDVWVPENTDFKESGWTSDLLQDFDGFSTSSDVMDTIERIVATRVRKSGIQYLVLYEGSTSDDAHWLPASFLTSKKDLELVQLFKAENLSLSRRFGGGSNTGISSLSDQDDEDEEEAGMYDDERLARVLQRQEDLGLGSNEVVLYGGDDTFDRPTSTFTSSSERFDRPSKKRQARSRRSEPSFPSASAMADALDTDPYGGFDIMDAERPSLRPRKKGRRGQMPPELSDSDLNEQLQSAWDADRQKKRLKKAEREELRKLGLLGRRGKAPDLSVKYKDGVSMNDVVEEVREFMFSDMQTLSLPPMESHRRAVVHQIVNQLGVNSKSRGEGSNRFTVLSKTIRTRKVDDAFFDALIHKKRFKARFEAVTHIPGNKSRAPRPVVSYKDGETVGASAPELGPENKGHAMLSKMGWSRGQGLGAVDNKGILQPLVHTVKTSKAGLQ